MVDLADVKINSEYEYIRATDPTAAENSAAGFLGGETWLNSDDGGSFRLNDPDAGAWAEIEESLDARINRVLRATQYRLFRMTGPFFYRYRQTGLTGDEFETALELTRFSRRVLVGSYSAFAEWTVDATAKTLTAASADDVSGEISDVAVGDTFQIRDSRRNDNLYTAAAVTSTVITVEEDTLTDDVDKFLVVPVFPTAEYDDVVGRMIWYDTVHRNIRAGLNSERIGSYSYTQGETVDGLEYPKDIAGGFLQYISAAPIGLADFVG